MIMPLIVTNVSYSCKMLIKRDTGCGIYGKSLYHLLKSFYKTNTVLKNEIYLKNSHPQFVSLVNPHFLISYFLKLGFTCMQFYNL